MAIISSIITITHASQTASQSSSRGPKIVPDAELRCRDAGMSLSKQKEVIDQIAAIIILEDWHCDHS